MGHMGTNYGSLVPTGGSSACWPRRLPHLADHLTAFEFVGGKKRHSYDNETAFDACHQWEVSSGYAKLNKSLIPVTVFLGTALLSGKNFIKG